MTALLFASTLWLGAQSAPLLPAAAQVAFDDALFVMGLRSEDFRATEPLQTGSALAQRFHRDPMKAAAEVAALARSIAEGSEGSLLRTVRQRFRQEDLPVAGPRRKLEFELPSTLPEPVRAIVGRLIEDVAEANDEVRFALSQLTPEEKRDLIEGLPRAAAPELVRFDFATRPMPTWNRIRTLMDRVDLARIRFAAERLYAQVESELASIDSIRTAAAFSGKFKFVAAGLTVVVAGTGDDVHEDRDAQLTIDFGGNDRYTGRHGAGIGYASVSIDLDGNDTYFLPDASLGTGLLGIGLSWDLNGHDLVRGGSLSLGCGVAGVGVFRSGGYAGRQRVDSERVDGVDSFITKSLSQGFGLYGVGLFDRQGRGEAEADYLSQGSALSDGVGWFISAFGGETFRLNGLAPSLESDRNLRSRGQGFGGRIGLDPAEPGGFGLMVSGSSLPRTLTAGVESQGCGLDGGVGVLQTIAGSTVLKVAGFGQGYGADQGIGLLLGDSGDDQYLGRTPSMGAGRDSGIGLLIDFAGDDLYDAGGGPIGGGSGGSVGLLLDAGGRNRRVAGSAGGSTADLGTLVLQLDCGSGLSSPELSGPPFLRRAGPGRGEGAVGTSPTPIGVDPPSLEPPARPLADSDAVARAIREASGLAEYASRAVRMQAQADLAAERLIWMAWAISEAASRPLLDKEIRLVAALSAKSEDAILEFTRRAADTNARIANAFLRWVAEAKIPGAAGAVRAGLNRPDTAATAARAAGALSLGEASGDLQLLCASMDPRVRREAARALSLVGGSEAFATAQALLSSRDWVVREAGVRLIGRLGISDLTPLSGLAESSDLETARAALRAISAVGTPAALAALGARLEDARAGMRIEALVGLDGRCPPEFRARIDARRNDVDRRVRLVAAAIDPGR